MQKCILISNATAYFYAIYTTPHLLKPLRLYAFPLN